MRLDKDRKRTKTFRSTLEHDSLKEDLQLILDRVSRGKYIPTVSDPSLSRARDQRLRALSAIWNNSVYEVSIEEKIFLAEYLVKRITELWPCKWTIPRRNVSGE